MEPPRERFERSISEQEERTKELLDNFKTEMMERFQKQEERIKREEEQDLMISRQSATILKLKGTLAEQKKTVEDQNETIQMISTHPALRELLHSLQTPSPPPHCKVSQRLLSY